jgi:hypothetical protein
MPGRSAVNAQGGGTTPNHEAMMLFLMPGGSVRGRHSRPAGLFVRDGEVGGSGICKPDHSSLTALPTASGFVLESELVDELRRTEPQIADQVADHVLKNAVAAEVFLAERRFEKASYAVHRELTGKNHRAEYPLAPWDTRTLRSMDSERQ